MKINKFEIKRILREQLENLSEEQMEIITENFFSTFKELGKDFVNLAKVTRRIATGAPRIPDLKRTQLKNLEIIKTEIKKAKNISANIKKRYATWLASNIPAIKDAKDYADLEINLDGINKSELYSEADLEWLTSQTKIKEAVQNIKKTNSIIIDAIAKEL